MEASDKFMFVNIREYLAEGDNDKVGEPESISRAPRSSLDSLGMLMIPCATLFCFSPIFSRSLQSMMPNSCIMVSLLYNIVYRTFLSTSTVLRLSFPLSGIRDFLIRQIKQVVNAHKKVHDIFSIPYT